MRFFQNRVEWLNKIRSIEFDIIFNKNINKRFHRALDLGAGEGFSSYRLNSISNFVFATDYNKSRLARIRSNQINRIVCDAEHLCFKKKQFDLVFSSNLLEHVLHPNQVLKNIYEILSDDGFVVITVPNRIWKILHLIFFYPNQMGSLIRRLFFSAQYEIQDSWSSNVKTKSRYSFLRRNIWPVPHGISKNNWSEFFTFSRNYWIKMFRENNFTLIREVNNLPLYSAHPLACLSTVLSVLSRLSLSSSHAFILNKTKI